MISKFNRQDIGTATNQKVGFITSQSPIVFRWQNVIGNFKIKLKPILFLLVMLSGYDFKSSKDYHREANKLEQEEKFKEANVLLDKAIEKDSSNIKALLDRGGRQINNRRFQRSY